MIKSTYFSILTFYSGVNMLINVGAEFNTHLESSDDAVELIDIINKIPEDNFIIDFKDVMFVTMNYAQAYYTAKLDSPKNISEINFSDEITVVMGAADEGSISTDVILTVIMTFIVNIFQLNVFKNQEIRYG